MLVVEQAGLPAVAWRVREGVMAHLGLVLHGCRLGFCVIHGESVALFKPLLIRGRVLLVDFLSPPYIHPQAF